VINLTNYNLYTILSYHDLYFSKPNALSVKHIAFWPWYTSATSRHWCIDWL